MITYKNKTIITSKMTKYIQKRIVDYRKAKKISQDELAKLLGIPRSTYAYHESKAGDLSVHFVEQVASALKIPYNELFPVPEFRGLKEPRIEFPKGESFLTTNFERKLIEKYRLLPTEARKEVRDFVDRLYEENKVKK